MCCVAGIDIASRKFDYRIIDASGKSLTRGSCEMTREGFTNFLSNVPEDTIFVMESTGRYHKNLCHFLSSKGLEVCIENPMMIKNYIKSTTLRKTKTDSAQKILFLENRDKTLTKALVEHEKKVHAKHLEILQSIPGVGEITLHTSWQRLRTSPDSQPTRSSSPIWVRIPLSISLVRAITKVISPSMATEVSESTSTSRLSVPSSNLPFS